MHLSIPIIIILKVLTRVLVKINKLINLNSNIPSTFSPREIQLTSKRKNVEKKREKIASANSAEKKNNYTVSPRHASGPPSFSPPPPPLTATVPTARSNGHDTI